MEPPTGQLLLGGLHVLTELEEAQGQPPAPAALLLVYRHPELGLLPCLVGGGQFRRQAQDLATGERRKLAAHGEGAVRPGLGHVELAAAGQGPHERRMTAAPGAQSESGRGGGQVEIEPLGGGVEPVGEVPDQPRRRRAQDAQPEPLDVGRSRVVAQGVDDATL